MMKRTPLRSFFTKEEEMGRIRGDYTEVFPSKTIVLNFTEEQSGTNRSFAGL